MSKAATPKRLKPPGDARIIEPSPFGGRPGPGKEPYNASEVVPVGDSRFLVCDNNVPDALFELRLLPDGRMDGPLVRRPLEGLPAGAMDDLEGMAVVEQEGRMLLFATPSLSLRRRKRHGDAKKKSQRGKDVRARNGLLRIELTDEGPLRAELLPDFKAWLVANAPEIGKSHRWLPDDGGLNVEGLGWDPAAGALLFGARTPVVHGQPLVLRVHLRDVAGPWTLDNFQILPAVTLAVEETRDEQGIRSIGYDPSRDASLVVVGNSTSSSKAPFLLYAWDGNADGVVRRFEDVWFAKGMKVEGVTHGTVGGRGAVVFVDDAGGFAMLWDDDERLR